MAATSRTQPRGADAGSAFSGARRWGWLLLAALPVFFVALGANTIWEANEAFYVDTPRHMVETGDYVTPYFNGFPRLNKPVLSYWIVAALYRVLGSTVTVERLGIALGAIGIIGCAFVLGKALRSTSTGLLAALFVATSPRVVMWSRRIFIDVYITLFMSLALACFVLAERHPEHRRRWLIGMYVAMGLGVLTKGPIALVFPVLVAALWMTFEKRWNALSTFMLVPGALIVLAIVCPWYVALYRAHGWGPIVQFFVGENLERFAEPDPTQNRNLLFYIPVLLTDLFPWAPLVIVALWSGWRRTADDARGSIRRLLWLWVVAIVGVFSLSQSKQDLYIFPVIAATAALIAEALERFGFGAGHRGARITLGVTAIVCVLVAGAGWWLFSWGYFALAGITPAALVLAGGALAAGGWLAAERQRCAVVSLAVTFVAFNYVLVARILPSLERLKPTAAIAAVVRERSGTQGNLAYFGLSLPSLSHYVGRPVIEIAAGDNARAFFFNANGAWVVTSDEGFQQLKQDVSTVCEIDRRPMFAATLADFIAHRAPRDVLLVTNRGCP